MKTITIRQIAEHLIRCFNNGGKVFVCGNGGSAAQALHFSGELLGRFEKDRKSLPCICLNADQATLTAIGNDYGYGYVFSRQLFGLGTKLDVILLLTTSGKSENLELASVVAKKFGMTSIAISGRDGGDLITDFQYIADGSSTAEIQETHLKSLHEVCRIIDAEYD